MVKSTISRAEKRQRNRRRWEDLSTPEGLAWAVDFLYLQEILTEREKRLAQARVRRQLDRAIAQRKEARR